MKNGAKGKGKSHSQYVYGEEKYKAKSDVVKKMEMNIPDFADSASDFFAKADEHERKNGRTYKEFELSLPREFSDAQNEQLINDFIVGAGLENQPLLAGFHAGKNGDNPHCHLMFSERPNADFSEDQFFKRNGSKKDRSFNDKSYLSECRQKWETVLNQHLELNRVDENVSCETLAKQGIDRLPQPKIGYAAPKIEKRSPGTSTRIKRFDEVMEFNQNKAIEVSQKIRIMKIGANRPAAARVLDLMQEADRFIRLSEEAWCVKKPTLLSIDRYIEVKNISEPACKAYINARQQLNMQMSKIETLAWYEIYKKPAMLIKAHEMQNKVESLHADIKQRVAVINKTRALKYNELVDLKQADNASLKNKASNIVDELKSVCGLGFEGLKSVANAEAETQRLEAEQLSEKNKRITVADVLKNRASLGDFKTPKQEREQMQKQDQSMGMGR